MHDAIDLRRLISTAVAAWLLVTAPGVVLAQDASPSPSVEASPAPVTASPAPVDASDHRPEGRWDVLAFDAWNEGLVEPRPNTPLTVSMQPAGRLEGLTGCGTYLGGYTLEGDRLGMRVISKGPDPCGPKRTEEAVAFSQALAAVETWRSTASGLELLDEQEQIRVVLTPTGEAGITGDWVVERFVRPDGKIVVPPEKSQPTLAFGAEGSARGSTGCRLFEGLYEVNTDNLLVVPLDIEGLPCEGAALRRERQFLSTLDEVVLWRREDDRLLLTDGEGLPRVELRPTNEVAE